MPAPRSALTLHGTFAHVPSPRFQVLPLSMQATQGSGAGQLSGIVMQSTLCKTGAGEEVSKQCKSRVRGLGFGLPTLREKFPCRLCAHPNARGDQSLSVSEQRNETGVGIEPRTWAHKEPETWLLITDAQKDIAIEPRTCAHTHTLHPWSLQSLAFRSYVLPWIVQSKHGFLPGHLFVSLMHSVLRHCVGSSGDCVRQFMREDVAANS